LPQIDTIREVLKKIDLSGLEALTSSVVNKAHNAVFVSLVGSQPRLTLDFELYKGSSDSSKKAEGELTASKRLLEKVRQTYNNMVDIVVYDALACNSVWINHCINKKITPVVHVKENNIFSIKEIKSKINKVNAGKNGETLKEVAWLRHMKKALKWVVLQGL